jgi:hypothetical protein
VQKRPRTTKRNARENAACCVRLKLPFAEYSVLSSLKLSGTTRLRSLTRASSWQAYGRVAPKRRKARRRNPRQLSLPVVIGSGSHPFPFRTRKLSLIPPMVLHGKLCGRVGRCRHYLDKRPDVETRRAFAFVGGLFLLAMRRGRQAGRSHITHRSRHESTTAIRTSRARKGTRNATSMVDAPQNGR